LSVTSGASRTITVASVPAGHVYVRHLAAPDGRDGVTRLLDVPPVDGATVPGGWWPPVMLDAGWIAAHADELDVFHVHFGFDAKTPDELLAVVRALRECDIPLVFTLHDLRNPHHTDTALHDAQLDVLVSHAAEIITLTPGAGAEIRRRWGRTVEILPHPHVVELARIGFPRPAGGGPFVVGLHAKSLRANMDVVAVAESLAGTVAELPGARLRVDVHDEIFEPAAHWYAPEVGAQLRALAKYNGHIELREHPYFSDAQLWRYFLELDVSVLPYRFGTHSGWLEACHDLGTTVIAPTCGFYAQQRPCLTYTHDVHHLDGASLAAAVRTAYERRPRWCASVDARRRERAAVAAAHRRLYERALAR
jgi:hypothetical protein